MSGLQSMLTPLETLPGWPAAPEPSVLQILGVLVAVPLILAIVISVWSYLATTRALKEYGPPVHPAVFAGAPALEGADSDVRPGIEAGSEAGVGGASARW